jgi:virginiamycin B lyase
MIPTRFPRIATAAIALAYAGALGAIAYPAFAQTLPDGNGKEMVQMICSGCHDLSPITEGGGSKDDWEAAVKSMIVMGADIKPDQVTVIVNYLAANFPAKKQ